jgi:hypothetical protein
VKITINIEGAGMLINIPLAIIKKALQSYGYTIVINNDRPTVYKEPHTSFKNIDEHLEYMKSFDNSKDTVEINMEHLPWGG